MDVHLIDEVAALLRRTGEAHHRAYAETDGADPEWAIWYAGYLQAHLGDRLGARLTRSEVVYLLLHAEREQARTGGDEPWADAYARVLVAR